MDIASESRRAAAVTRKDREILRELAKACAELAAHPANRERERRIRDMHSLKPVRPPVWLDELPWHEMDIDGQLAERCETERGREMERHFRRILFRWRHFQADMVVEGAYYVPKAYDIAETGPGIRERTIATDSRNNIVSHRYEDQLDTDEKLDALRAPAVTARRDLDEESLAAAEDALGGAMPARLRGHGIYHAPWDELSMLRGVENCLIDIADRPDFIHRTMSKLTEIGLSKYEQMEAEGLLDFSCQSLHCTPPYTDELPAKDYAGGGARLKDMWFRGMAQMLSTVSPAQRDEFDLQYMRRIMDRCGLSYYGCCEPLHLDIPYLKKIPNMRKIGISPWADVASAAEQIGGGYVFARKPNPAMVAGAFDEEAVRRETAETIEACMKNGCPYEFVLKDISTAGYRPQNIIDWTRTVMGTIDEYYG
ncbi:MAG: uroporphyrinogen decarboxylase family protein [Clostridiales bacterium]|jgi:hypothetical protein|nr:uroporphyrinogen decarboxylase family protein [Clostridiales bacterium]